jgi:hypothetical protein
VHFLFSTHKFSYLCFILPQLCFCIQHVLWIKTQVAVTLSLSFFIGFVIYDGHSMIEETWQQCIERTQRFSQIAAVTADSRMSH